MESQKRCYQGRVCRNEKSCAERRATSSEDREALIKVSIKTLPFMLQRKGESFCLSHCILNNSVAFPP